MRELLRKFRRFTKLGWAQAQIPLGYRADQLRFYPTAPSVRDYFNRNFKVMDPAIKSRTLDIGCGTSIKNPFSAYESLGIDIRENKDKNILSADLNIEKIPFPDAYFDFVTAYDFLEHVPRVSCIGKTRFPFVELMSEINRVLKVDGLFFSHTPAYPSKQAFQDPTHVNLITEDTFPCYFCGDQPWARMYGFTGNFELVAQEWWHCWLLTIIRKRGEHIASP